MPQVKGILPHLWLRYISDTLNYHTVYSIDTNARKVQVAAYALAERMKAWEGHEVAGITG